MSQYFIYYTESSIVCLIIFGIILLHDLSRIDRQEKQIRFDYALASFMLYFISDAAWAAVISGVIPKTPASVIAVNFFNNFFMALITYNWFMYALAVEKVGLPYTISIAFGYDELSPYGESFEECLRRADEKSYKDKAIQKRR